MRERTSSVSPGLVLVAGLDDEGDDQPDSAAQHDRQRDHGQLERVLMPQNQGAQREEEYQGNDARDQGAHNP